MRIAVIDTETTGIDVKVEKIVELAGRAFDWEAENKLAADQDWNPHVVDFTQITNPGKPIPPEAMAVHHITEADVLGRPSPADALLEMMQNLAWPSIMVAHNAEYDRGILREVNDSLDKMTWICTWRCAMHLYPDAPGHSNQVLRYWLDLDVGTLPPDLFPHRALYDVIVTWHLLLRMLETHTVEQLVDLSTRPALLKKIRFGKHRGMEWANLPRDYLSWVARQGDMDADSRHTAMHYLRGDSRLL